MRTSQISKLIGAGVVGLAVTALGRQLGVRKGSLLLGLAAVAAHQLLDEPVSKAVERRL